jgi:uncharacterized protein (DUF2062 family)
VIFRRRARLGFWTRLRMLAAPAKGWRRGFAYLGRRIQRLPDTPHRIALGCACGVFASFSPFFGLHLFVAAAFAWAVNGNVIASAFGQVFGNWLTFPIIAAVCMEIGGWITGMPTNIDSFDLDMMFSDFGYFFHRIFVPYGIGGILPGLACAAVSYYAIRPIVAVYQKRRRGRLIAATRDRVAAHLKGRAPKSNPVAEPRPPR